MNATVREKTTPAEGYTVSNKNHKNDVHCWESFCEDLIYAAAFSAESYVFAANKRQPKGQELVGDKRTKALAQGQAIHDALKAEFPDLGKLQRAQRVMGHMGAMDQNSVDQRKATLLRFTAFLPKRPA